MLYFLLDTLGSSFSAHAEAPASNTSNKGLSKAPGGVPDRAAVARRQAPVESSGAAAAASAPPAAAATSSTSEPHASPAPQQQNADQDRLQELLGNSCVSRACSSTRDLFAEFGAQLKQRNNNESQGGVASAAALAGNTSSTTAPGAAEGDGQAAAAAAAAQPQPDKPPFWFLEDGMPDPPDVIDIGRATWTLLHTMAAYYPDQPTPQQQQSMAGFVAALGDHYPCHECRAHLRKDLERHPPDVSNAAAMSAWACGLHNRVNVYLGKPEFDCGLALQRWRDGPPAAAEEQAGGNGAGQLNGLAAHNREVDAQQEVASAAGGGGRTALERPPGVDQQHSSN